jgi:hypothetical protein
VVFAVEVDVFLSSNFVVVASVVLVDTSFVVLAGAVIDITLVTSVEDAPETFVL